MDIQLKEPLESVGSLTIEEVRQDFEDWYSKTKRVPHAEWHADETRYTMMSHKQSAWEVWFSAYSKYCKK